MKRSEMTKEQLKARIMTRLRVVICRMDGIIADKRYWNATRTDAEPFDLGWELAMRDATVKELDAWERDDMKTVAIMAERLARLARMPEAMQ